MEVQHLCFNEFPEQCAGCSEYRESVVDQTAQFALLANMGMIYVPGYKKMTVKECARYHKRKVEYI